MSDSKLNKKKVVIEESAFSSTENKKGEAEKGIMEEGAKKAKAKAKPKAFNYQKLLISKAERSYLTSET